MLALEGFNVVAVVAHVTPQTNEAGALAVRTPPLEAAGLHLEPACELRSGQVRRLWILWVHIVKPCAHIVGSAVAGLTTVR